MRESGVILAKSSTRRITLQQHTRNVMAQWANSILPMHRFAADKYARVIGKSLDEVTRFVITWHDAGKMHKDWQDACWRDYIAAKQWEDTGRIGKAPSGTALMRTGIRHEMDSLLRVREKYADTSPVIIAAIAAHHSKLGEKHRERWEKDDMGRFLGEWKQLRKLGNSIIAQEPEAFAKALLQRYEYAGPRAFLQLADHRASAAEDEKPLTELKPFEYEFPYNARRGVQQKITALWDEPFALLRAPTGAGKTDAALLWAQHQIECGRADRLVIAMPTRFTANALSISTAETLSLVGLHHSSAWYQKRDKPKEVADAEQEMARLLETPVTVTTLDHLCISLTGAREDHHATFFNLAHSCVMIDEADFYDDFTQANLVVLLRALRVLQVPVLLMSATLPESSRQLYTVAEQEPVIHEDTSENDRPRCELKRYPQPIVTPNDLRPLLETAIETIATEPTIIYVNTVQRAQRVYNWLCNNGADSDDVVLYHSRYTEPDKKGIEERLTTMLGRDAWKSKSAHGIAVLTQIGELSVNISANTMISELCPLDRLVQRIGRLARFADENNHYTTGILHLVQPHKATAEGSVLYPAPYGKFGQKKQWEASLYLTESDKALTNRVYTANDFVQLVNDLYKTLPETPLDARLNADRLLNCIASNWLIVPGNEVTDDADETGGVESWRCRDIAPQVTLLAGMKEDNGLGNSGDSHVLQTNYKNWREWQKVVLEHGVTCYAYELSKAVENAMVSSSTITIGQGRHSDDVRVWLVKDQFYDEEQGLRLRDVQEEDAE